ncbi:RsiV family protein [Paenibacillus sp. NAIST15-1]|uniref:RsiV family protein n=1 Tax=Paenibacillus sp. NAIST15-1 TaxID=1605994 RepID=UPI00086EBA4A|nr:RsiV family protein [Paenibacillus sp. NAIST15-1]GAV13004.1 anti-sigma factor homolog yrhM [Paenibacillus sp. NAIST15-1]
MSEQLDRLKRKYKDIPIPKELDSVVKSAIKQGKKKRKRVNWTKKLIGAGAAAAILMIAGINTSPAFAKAISNVPLVGSLVSVLTFTEFTVNEETAKANIKVPAITNMDNKALETAINNKYLEENKKLYNDFKDEMEEVKKSGGGHVGVESGYEVKTDNNQILAIGRYVANTVGTSSTTFTYNTIDKQNQLLITLPSLFKDNSYIQLISENIKEQMKQQMKSDSDKTYWLDGEMGFKTITHDQSFYINNNGKLVISFNKYDVAPGYMGVVEFIIPTKVIADVLVSNVYVK